MIEPTDDAQNLIDEAGAWPDEAPTDRVIVIGWQALFVPLLLVAVVGAGYLYGRTLAPPPPAPVVASAPDPAAAAPIAIDPNVPQVIQVPPDVSSNPYGNAPVELPPSGHPMVDRVAPDFTMNLVGTDEQVSLSDYLGKPVMINFWATWCPPCRYEMPWIQSVYDQHKDKGFVVLAVDAGEKMAPSLAPDAVLQYVNAMGLTFPVLMGDNTYDLQRAWQVYGLPSTFLLDATGKVVEAHTGMYPNQATLENQLRSILEPAAGAES